MDISLKNETQISFFRSMRGKLILLFLAVALIPLGIAGAVALVQLTSALKPYQPTPAAGVTAAKTPPSNRREPYGRTTGSF
jgi:hypothetical protein